MAIPANCTLWLKMNGSDSGTFFTDEVGATVTAVSTAQTKTAIKYSGVSSAYFSGPADSSPLSINSLTGRPHLTLPSISGYDFSSDHTVEGTVSLWVYLNDHNKIQHLIGNGGYGASSALPGFVIYLDVNNKVNFQIMSGTVTANQCIAISTSSIPLSTWTRIKTDLVVDGSGRRSKLYINEILETTSSYSTTNLGASSDVLRIGCGRLGSTFNYLSYPSDCYIDDVLITQGGLLIDPTEEFWTNFVNSQELIT